jgi:hypothetical protein
MHQHTIKGDCFEFGYINHITCNFTGSNPAGPRNISLLKNVQTTGLGPIQLPIQYIHRFSSFITENQVALATLGRFIIIVHPLFS